MQKPTRPQMPPYRYVSKGEEALIKRVLDAADEMLKCHREIESFLRFQHEEKQLAAKRLFAQHNVNAEQDELDRFLAAEPMRWAAMGKTDIQRGTMALLRALEQPSRG